MPSPENDTRTVHALTTGSKICLLVSLPVLVAAAYFLWVQISIPSSEGGSFWCSSAFSPPTDQFPKGVCKEAIQIYQLRAALLLVAGLLIAGLGVLFFGVDRRIEKRKVRYYYEDKGRDD